MCLQSFDHGHIFALEGDSSITSSVGSIDIFLKFGEIMTTNQRELLLRTLYFDKEFSKHLRIWTDVSFSKNLCKSRSVGERVASALAASSDLILVAKASQLWNFLILL